MMTPILPLILSTRTIGLKWLMQKVKPSHLRRHNLMKVGTVVDSVVASQVRKEQHTGCIKMENVTASQCQVWIKNDQIHELMLCKIKPAMQSKLLDINCYKLKKNNIHLFSFTILICFSKRQKILKTKIIVLI